MTDLVTFGEATLRLAAPDGARLDRTATFEVSVGGPEAAVAVAAASLDADAIWLSRLPDGPHGRRAVNHLRSHGVRTGVVWADDDSRMATRFVEPASPPRSRTVLDDSDDTAFADVTADQLPGGALRETDWVHVTGATPARSPSAAEATAHALELAAGAGTTVAYDLRYRARQGDPEAARERFASLAPHLDVLFATTEQARSVLDHEGPAVEVAHALRTANDLDTVVLRRATGDALAAHGDEVHEEPAVPVEAVDDAGAADAFVGGYLAGRVDGRGVGEALSWATATAALSRTLAGDAVAVSRADVTELAAADRAD